MKKHTESIDSDSSANRQITRTVHNARTKNHAWYFALDLHLPGNLFLLGLGKAVGFAAEFGMFLDLARFAQESLPGLSVRVHRERAHVDNPANPLLIGARVEQIPSRYHRDQKSVKN